MRALITGASGFVGLHLARHLENDRVDVFGLSRSGAPASNVKWAGWFRCDITDQDGISSAVRQCSPEWVFHLAGPTMGNLSDLLRFNVVGTDCLLAVLEKHAPKARVLVNGSAAEYGESWKIGGPIREDFPLQPVSAYGVSKVAQEAVAGAYVLRHGLDVMRTRTFNLTGPGQPPSLVCSAFAHQIAALEKSGERTLLVGALDSERDFVDVRDAVRAYGLLIRKAEPGSIYNVCSGTSVAIRSVLKILVERSKVELGVIPREGMGEDRSIYRGDQSRLAALTGWKPTFTLDQTLGDLLDEHRLSERRQKAAAY